jgi:hypothetical protein
MRLRLSASRANGGLKSHGPSSHAFHIRGGILVALVLFCPAFSFKHQPSLVGNSPQPVAWVLHETISL